MIVDADTALFIGLISLALLVTFLVALFVIAGRLRMILDRLGEIVDHQRLANAWPVQFGPYWIVMGQRFDSYDAAMRFIQDHKTMQDAAGAVTEPQSRRQTLTAR